MTSIAYELAETIREVDDESWSNIFPEECEEIVAAILAKFDVSLKPVLKDRPTVTVWGLRGGPSGDAPWRRVATDADLRRSGKDPAEYNPEVDSGHWAW